MVASTCGCAYLALRGRSMCSKTRRAERSSARLAMPSSRSSATIAFAASLVSSVHSSAHARNVAACSSRAIRPTCPFSAFSTAFRCFAPACANIRFAACAPSRVWIMRRNAGPASDCAASCLVPGPPTSRYSASAACTSEGDTSPFSRIGRSAAFICRSMPCLCAAGLARIASRRFRGASSPPPPPPAAAPPAPKNANSEP